MGEDGDQASGSLCNRGRSYAAGLDPELDDLLERALDDRPAFGRAAAVAPLDGHLGARVDLEGLGHARAVAEEVAGEVVGAAREGVAAGGVRARDRLVVLGRVVPVGIVETWEGALALCADEAVGSLERACVNDYSGWRETRTRETRTHIDYLA